jgi:hypothetical protein
MSYALCSLVGIENLPFVKGDLEGFCYLQFIDFYPDVIYG